MSECMPVCSVPVGWDLSLPDTVGRPIGPSVAIACPETGQVFPYGRVGEILIHGPGVLRGYEGASQRDSFWLFEQDPRKELPTQMERVSVATFPFQYSLSLSLSLSLSCVYFCTATSSQQPLRVAGVAQ
jgi:hypothetical protein